MAEYEAKQVYCARDTRMASSTRTERCLGRQTLDREYWLAIP